MHYFDKTVIINPKEEKANGNYEKIWERGGASLLSRYSKGFEGTAIDRNCFRDYSGAGGGSVVEKTIPVYRIRVNKAFTLAEVLITLGIIGIVAALTIPTISHNIQQAVLKNQFKKFYSTFWQAVIGIQTKEGRPVQCYYWDGTNPYTGKCTPTCDEDEKNQYGNCTVYRCAETGDPLPADLNGKFSECSEFHEELFLKTLKTTKICKNKAYEQGCLPDDFRGANIVKSEQNPDKEYDPNGMFSDSSVKNNYPVFVLADGTYIIEYYAYLGGIPVYVVDINGTKGPNKWGYDIFSFGISGNKNVGIGSIVQKQFNYAKEEGGKYFQYMYNEAFNIK